MTPSTIDYKNFHLAERCIDDLWNEITTLTAELETSEKSFDILKTYAHSLLVRLKVDERFVEDVVDIHIANRLKETKA